MQSEASAIADIAARLGVIPTAPVKNAHRLIAGVEVGERLCRCFELYHQIVHGATMTMEQFILLVVSLAERRILSFEYCGACRGVLVVDCPGAKRWLCPTCRKIPQDALEPLVAKLIDSPSTEGPAAYQESLF